MKIFLSWSGDYSQKVASLFSGWIPCVLQQVDVFLSTNAIEAGDKWNDVISFALDEIDFGVLFITDENKDKPWLLFEAGALAKNIDKGKVVPVLIDTKKIDLSNSPLFGFQYKEMSKEGVFGLMRSIYASIPDPIIDRATLSRCLEKWWPELESAYNSIEISKPKKAPAKLTETERLARIEEALGSVLSSVSRGNVASKSNERFFTNDAYGFFNMVKENLSLEGFEKTKRLLKNLPYEEQNKITEAKQIAMSTRGLKNKSAIVELIDYAENHIELPF